VGAQSIDFQKEFLNSFNILGSFLHKGHVDVLPIICSLMQEAAKILNEFKIPFEINALSAHRCLNR